MGKSKGKKNAQEKLERKISSYNVSTDDVHQREQQDRESRRQARRARKMEQLQGLAAEWNVSIYEAKMRDRFLRREDKIKRKQLMKKKVSSKELIEEMKRNIESNEKDFANILHKDSAIQRKKDLVTRVCECLPEFWQQHPKNVRGKNIGLWYKERSKLISDIIEYGELGENATDMHKKVTSIYKEFHHPGQKKRGYPLSLPADMQEKISAYLSSVKHKPSASLGAQVQFWRSEVRSKGSEIGLHTPGAKNVKCGAFSLADIEAYMEAKYTPPLPIQPDVGVNESDWKHQEACLSQETKLLRSMDKYKHLEESDFKLKFLNSLSGTIECNLEKAVKNGNCQPRRNNHNDYSLRVDFSAVRNTPDYKIMLAEREFLPAWSSKFEILDMIRNNQVILISGETGCGKTTQVAQFILDDAIVSGNGSCCNIICTQPRRISAISVAERVAQERCEVVGQGSVGYQIRLEKAIGRNYASILYCTTGILLQRMHFDPALSKFSHVILDEIHERDVICDFSMALLKDVIKKRSNLKVILMSATLNAELFTEYFNQCPMINIPGYTYPVKEYYLEDILHETKFRFNFTDSLSKIESKRRLSPGFNEYVVPYLESLPSQGYDLGMINELMHPDSERSGIPLILELLHYICSYLEPGAILIFLPGWEEITAVCNAIRDRNDVFPESSFLVIPLHSMLPNVEQRSVFKKPPPGITKIVVATNIAESSITIDDILYVIDSGMAKVKNFDVANNITALDPQFVSLANVKQRCGRAGRVRSGYCFHLYTRGRQNSFPFYPVPEMLRTRLEEVILNIKILQLGKVETFLGKVMNPPSPDAVTLCLDLLVQLNALDENENLTPLGYYLAQFPSDPRIGKMLIFATIFQCLNPMLCIAANLGFRDPFYIPKNIPESVVRNKKKELDGDKMSDHLISVEILNKWEELRSNRLRGEFCREHFLSFPSMETMHQSKSQYMSLLKEMDLVDTMNCNKKSTNAFSDKVPVLKAVICAAFYPYVATLRPLGKRRCGMQTAEDGTVTVSKRSIHMNRAFNEYSSRFLVYHEKMRHGSVFLYGCTMIHPMSLLLFCNNFQVTFNEEGNAEIFLKDNLTFRCSAFTYEIIKELKIRLDWIIEFKLTHPKLPYSSGDAALLQLVRELLMSVEKEAEGQDEEEDDDNDEEQE